MKLGILSKFLQVNMKERDFQEGLSVEGRTILDWTLLYCNACKYIGLAVNIGKTKYMEVGRHRGMIANAHIKI